MYVRNSKGYIKLSRVMKDRRMVICFTGHRPSSLGGYNWNTSLNQAIMRQLTLAILQVMERADTRAFLFIFGGALGIDQMAFEIVYGLREKLGSKYDIRMRLAIPFEDQPLAWKEKIDFDRYVRHMDQADEIVYVDELEGYTCTKAELGRYHKDKLLTRNKYMVDQSEMVIAVWNGMVGGTAHCVRYAQKKNRKVKIVTPVTKRQLKKAL